MAIRSGAGTGVLVALVVFVVATVFLLVITIVFYAGKNDAAVRANTADAELGTFISRAQLQSDEAKQLKQLAVTEKQSLYAYLIEQRAKVAAWTVGNRTADPATMQTELDVAADKTVKDVVTDLRRQLRSKTDEANSLNARLADANKATSSAKEETETARKEGDRKVEAIHTEVAEYQGAAKKLRGEVEDAMKAIAAVKTEIEQRYKAQIDERQNELDITRQEIAIKDSRLAALQKKVEQIELKPTRPDELVDGRIIAIEGSGDQVFINIGRNDRVVAGMTFEVFDDANAIQNSDRTGMSRGKASIQVLRVADATSTCKIIRQAPGRPVVKDDVVANAVFNPNYQFKFLVHGKFDVDGDGKPSDSEADYLRGRIKDWGGEVVLGDELRGELDFLVLGVQPPLPTPLPNDATEAQVMTNLEARKARESYDRLFKQATDARIPVLNWNRFQILTGGMTGR